MNRYNFTDNAIIEKPKLKDRSGRWCICSVCGKEMDLDNMFVCSHLKPPRKNTDKPSKSYRHIPDF